MEKPIVVVNIHFKNEDDKKKFEEISNKIKAKLDKEYFTFCAMGDDLELDVKIYR